MKWGYRKLARSKRQKNWHRWFAWRPIKLRDQVNPDHDGIVIWLEWIERKGQVIGNWHDGLGQIWSYRLPQEQSIQLKDINK